MAIPWRNLVDPDKLTDDVLSQLNTTGGLTINSPWNSGPLGYNKYENILKAINLSIYTIVIKLELIWPLKNVILNLMVYVEPQLVHLMLQ